MNKIISNEVFYIRPDKTIETLILNNTKTDKLFFIFNNQGLYFNVFHNIIELLKYLNNKISISEYFEDEDELDYFLSTYNIQ